MSSAPLSSSTLPPPREVGRYLMFGVIASGGMAAVHYGLMNGPVGFRRTVAMKRLHEQFAEDPEFVSQFLDEARLAARIRHPNVVQTLDVVAQSRQLLLVMEYVDGETLARLMVGSHKRKEHIPVEHAVGILAGALHGLHAAHEATDEHGLPLRIVHRDVSPQNILVGLDGVSRVLDFGVAKAAARIHSTQGAKIKGKLRYMAPEQVGGSGVDRRTDVFAAGIVLWECLAGRRLFHSEEGAAAIINQVLTQPIEPPSKYRSVPPGLDKVVARALERDPNARYQTALEMAIALEEVVRIPSAHAAGVWVKSIAGDDLDERARVIARIEAHASGDRTSLTSFSDVQAFATPPGGRELLRPGSERKSGSQKSVPPTETMTLAEPSREKNRRKQALGALSVFALCALAWGLLRPPHDAAGTVGARTEQAAKGETTPEGKVSSDGLKAESQARETNELPAGEEKRDSGAAVPAEAEPEAVGENPEAPEPAQTKPLTATAQKSALPKTALPKRAACASPTYVDEKGIRRFKVECL